MTSPNVIASINPIRYRGYYYDSDTGFYCLQSRYYDPELRRFINADGYASTGQGFKYVCVLWQQSGDVMRLYWQLSS